MKASISEIVGHAENAKGREVSVYRALRPLLCTRCGAEIKESELFTRGELAGIRISPCCRECVPFSLSTAKQLRSPLIEALLNSGSNVRQLKPHLSAPDKKAIEKEVEHRLGPALAISRKRRR